ncbi:MAG: protein-L-isoaspartate(D-aspartate) O-methyltransferase [Flavobacteriales bacterium]|jgi:protein-L-isoaspartate(D-aspartate) O-methyltransferase|nr:protein-L-isoaspartate(D-aspartate) O-methyltransferase [Flavobacteriales bacterium]
MPPDDYRHQGQRRQLVEELKKKGITDAAVLAAIGKVPRHQFIDDTAFERFAYVDKAFPIDCGQTISQPYTVAFQSQLLQVKRGEKVLEVGTGSGYQTAILCELGAKVFSIERHKPLHIATKRRLAELGYRPTLVHGDGYLGMPLHGPFNKVIVTCGAPDVPAPLMDQLLSGGRLVIPVGDEEGQRMLTIDISPQGPVRKEHGAFSFVPMLEHKAKG